MEPDNPSSPGWSIGHNLGHTSAVPNTVIKGLTSAGQWTVMPPNNATIISSPITNGTVNSGDLSVSDGAGGWIKVGEALRKIMDRLAILEPDMEKMERYPALKAAYDNYKIMEALLNEEVAGRK